LAESNLEINDSTTANHWGKPPFSVSVLFEILLAVCYSKHPIFAMI
jgi:hypothetical protein